MACACSWLAGCIQYVEEPIATGRLLLHACLTGAATVLAIEGCISTVLPRLYIAHILV